MGIIADLFSKIIQKGRKKLYTFVLLWKNEKEM